MRDRWFQDGQSKHLRDVVFCCIYHLRKGKRNVAQVCIKLSDESTTKKPSNYDSVRIGLLNLVADEFIKSVSWNCHSFGMFRKVAWKVGKRIPGFSSKVRLSFADESKKKKKKAVTFWPTYIISRNIWLIINIRALFVEWHSVSVRTLLNTKILTIDVYIYITSFIPFETFVSENSLIIC